MPPSSISGKETKKNNAQMYFVVKHSLSKNQLKSANRTQCCRHLLEMIGDQRIHGISQKRNINPFLGSTSYHHDFIAAKKCGYVVKRRRLILGIIFLGADLYRRRGVMQGWIQWLGFKVQTRNHALGLDLDPTIKARA